MPLDNFIFLITFMLPTAYNLILIVTILNITWRLETINDFLGVHLTSKELKLILKIYSQLHDTVSHVNKYFTINTMICLEDALVILLMLTLLAYDIVAHSLTIQDVILMLGGIAKINVLGFTCVMVIVYSSKVSSLKKSSLLKINEIRLKNNRQLGRICELGILQIDSTISQISCGLFTFNSFFFFTIISSFFSYFVVVIQFDIMIENNLMSLDGDTAQN